MNEWYEGVGSAVYDGSTSLAMFRSLDRCMYAHRAWLDYHRRRSWLEPTGQAALPARYALAAMAPCSGGYMFSERESKQGLARVGIPVVRDFRAQAAAEAVQIGRAHV